MLLFKPFQKRERESEREAESMDRLYISKKQITFPGYQSELPGKQPVGAMLTT